MFAGIVPATCIQYDFYVHRVAKILQNNIGKNSKKSGENV
jgi:hypothetical protein